MQEKDIYDARSLLQMKEDVKFTLHTIKEEKQKIDIRIGVCFVPVRKASLEDMLTKEYEYINSRLRSLGVTELE